MRAWLLCASFLAIVLASPASASPIPIPLGPGETYYLAFVAPNPTGALGNGQKGTSSRRIEDYDAFVQDWASGEPSLTPLGLLPIRAIVSTVDVAARDHVSIGPTDHIFNLHGDLVAIGYDDFFDGSILAALDILPSGNSSGTIVWTGSDSFGGIYAHRALGSREHLCPKDPFSGELEPCDPYEYGLPSLTTVYYDFEDLPSNWLASGARLDTHTDFNPFGYYGIAGPIVVGGPILVYAPEPRPIALMSLLLVVELRRQHRRRLHAVPD